MKTFYFLATFLLFTSLSFGQQVYLSEDFSAGQMPPNGWTIDGLPAQWSVSGSQVAGGTSPEAKFTYLNTIASSRLISPEIDLTGLSSVTLIFNHFYDDYTGEGPVVGVATRSAGGSWRSIWEINPTSNVGPETIILELTTGFAYPTFQFCFYIDGNLYNVDYWYLDDIILFIPFNTDALLSSVHLPAYVQLGSEVELTGVMKNIGTSTITSFDLSYTIDGGSPVVYSVTGINVMLGESFAFIHGTPLVFNDEGTHEVVINIESVNGGPDDNPGNNILTKYVGVLPYLPPKKVFAEEATGTWCGWCVRGICFMDYMAETYPDTWIGVAVHNADPMTNTVYDNAIQNIIPNFPGWPSGTIDRAGDNYWDPQDFEQGYLQRIEAVSPASIDIVNFSWDPDTRAVSFDLQSEFIVDINHELRYAVVFAEDSLWGTTAQWNQANYYSGGGNGPMCGFENLPDPVPAADMHYDHVAREILDTPYGTVGSLPNPIPAGSIQSYTYNYTIPQSWNFDKLHIIGILIDMSTGEVLNANDVISSWTGIKGMDLTNQVSIYPNPFNDFTRIKFNLTQSNRVEVNVYDLLGRTVLFEPSRIYPAGENNIRVDGENLNNGVYFVELTIGDRKFTEKVSVIK